MQQAKLLPVLLLAQAACSSSKPSAYWGSYSGYLSGLLDEAFTNRSGVFLRPKGFALPADVGVENDGSDAPWFVSNANVSSLGGMTKLSRDP